MNPLDDAIVNSILVHLLVSVRFLGVIFTAGVFVLPSLPVPVRFWLSVALALVLTPILDVGMPTLFTTAPLFVLTMLARELIIGVAIGFFSSLPLHALQMSGYLEGTLMGFNMMNIFDPLSESQSSVIAQVKYLLAIWFYLHWNGHMLLIQALSESFNLIPLSRGEWGVVVSGLPWGIWLQSAFVLALKLSLPIFGALLLAEVGLGFVARTVPQMNVFVLGIPLKIGLGLILLLTVLPMTADVLHEEVEKSVEAALKGAFLWR